MSDEAEALGIIWKSMMGIMGMGGIVIGFFTRRVVNDVESLKKSDSARQLDLADFKTDVANNYSKEASTQASLGRIHDRIDDVSADIKTLLARHP